MPQRDPEGTVRKPPEPEREAEALIDAEASPGESRLRADPARLAEGWERRFIIEGTRVAEYVRLYESLGFEVMAEPLRASDAKDECTDCHILALLKFRMLYTRTRQSDAAP